ncbi:hypothetical protein BD413DRAFT_301548 [Trametes elegans]|nr:hypothetical protein BD413DRAFT_301548 [Trametes elegans]
MKSLRSEAFVAPRALAVVCVALVSYVWFRELGAAFAASRRVQPFVSPRRFDCSSPSCAAHRTQLVLQALGYPTGAYMVPLRLLHAWNRPECLQDDLSSALLVDMLQPPAG